MIEELIKISDSSSEDVERITAELLDLPEPPTAIFALNDLMAISAMHTAREKGRSIPEELSIVGFDNTLLSRSTDPPLTTVEQPIQDMCTKVVDLLIAEIEGKSKDKQRVVFLPQLIVRKSTCQCS
ncbi:LacI family DNA-binding transcriptional regulator [Caldalkalibacillus mannanilyticus]|uniref:LacI family DNA-binding transcriptional regulator n=1 Tax=Caldalkalibacillus mannanilyticus TaxID=1418 RepID=UPI000A547B3F